MVTLDGDSSNDSKNVRKVSLSLRVSVGALLAFIGQTFAMGYFIAQKVDRNEMTRHIEQVDAKVTPLPLVQSKQVDVIAKNDAQDVRLRELEGKVSDLQKQAVENKVWLDQLVSFYRSYAHPVPPR